MPRNDPEEVSKKKTKNNWAVLFEVIYVLALTYFAISVCFQLTKYVYEKFYSTSESVTRIKGIELIGRYDAPASISGIHVKGDYAYIISSSTQLDINSMRVIDISKPHNPVEVASCDIPYKALEIGSWVNDIFVSEDYAYMTCGSSGFWVIDIINPKNPVKIGFYEPNFYLSNLDVSGDYAYIASTGGLIVIDISNPNNPVEISSCHISSNSWGPNFFRDIDVSGDYAHVWSSSEGWFIININNPSNPVEVESFCRPLGSSSSIIYDLHVSGDYAYVISTKGLSVIDLSNPHDLKKVDSYYCSFVGRADIVFVNDYVYIASSEGSEVIDTRLPGGNALSEKKWVVGTYESSIPLTHLDVRGDYIYVTGGNELLILSSY